MQFEEDIRLTLDGPVIGLDEHVLNLTELGPVLVEFETLIRRCHTLVQSGTSVEESRRRAPKASKEIQVLLRKQTPGSLVAHLEIVGTHQIALGNELQRATANAMHQALEQLTPLTRNFRTLCSRARVTARAVFRVGENEYRSVVIEPESLADESATISKPRSGIVEGKVCAIHFSPPSFSVRSNCSKDIKVLCSDAMLKDATERAMSDVRVWFKLNEDGSKTAIRSQFLPDTEQRTMIEVASSVASRWERALQLLGQ